tara:strand:+ start:1732 stop:2646 length:915 start_codon:yes stop_codon:yes gene_type:complete
MVIATGSFAEDLWPGIVKWFGDSYKDWNPIWESLVEKYDSNKQFEKFQGVTNYGLAGVKDQGGSIPYRDKYQGYPREIINVTYGIGSTITYEMMRYDQYNLFESIPSQLGKSVRKTEETVVANLLNNGFSTATTPTLTADGLSLFNSAHLLVADSATQRNTPATASDLSQTALEQMYIDIGNFVDDQGLPIVVTPQKLIIPIESQHIARKILGTEYEVGTGNNTINPVSSSRMPLELIVSPWLTDTDAWFVKTDEKDGLVFTNVDEVMLDRDNDFDTKNLKFSAVRLFGTGAVNYLGYYGSPGA